MTPSKDACSCCREIRAQKDEAPRQLKRLPMAIVQGGLFNKPGLPIRLCTFCDGDAYQAAMKTHRDRK